MSNTYTCASCGGVFKKGWSDEEAQKEYETVFPETQEDETGIVCDDCYKEILIWAQKML